MLTRSEYDAATLLPAESKFHLEAFSWRRNSYTRMKTILFCSVSCELYLRSTLTPANRTSCVVVARLFV
jgi:hypothetical protein